MRTDIDTLERPTAADGAPREQSRDAVRDERAARTWEFVGRIALYVALAIVAIPFVMPTWWMITSSLKPVSEIFAYPPTLWPSSPTFQAYIDAFTLQPFARQYFNSLYIAVFVTLGTILISSLAGYAFARIRFPGNNFIFMVVLVGLLIPAEVTIVPLFQMFNGWGMVNTHWPLLLATTFGAPSVLATFIMRQFFLTLPVELDEAARLDGLGRFGMWWRISMPLARTAVAAVGIFTFQHVWNLYLEPTVFLQSPEMFTLPQALTRFTDAYGGEMWNVQLAAATMTVIPVLLVFILAQKQFIQGLAHTGLKG